MTTSVDQAHEGYSKEAMDKLNKIWDDLDAQAILKHSENNERIAAKAKHRDRRERIATAVLAGIVAHHGQTRDIAFRATAAVAHADALIAELDKPKEVKS